jgi:sugar (pentulose or hexulose) kinase
VLGSGALEPSIGSLSYGTTATVNTTQRRYVESVPLVPPYPAAVPGAYSLEVQVYRGYWLVEWFKRQFGATEVARAETLGVAPEALFDDLVRSTEPGSLGLMLQPTWTPGVRIPGPEAKGALIGFGDVHTRAHLYRAILEGLAYALREGGERAASRARVPLRELRISGGGAQSPAAVQLTADIFGLPVGRSSRTHEASGLGAAIDAAVGLGLHSSFESAVADMVHIDTVIEPDPDRHRLYDQLYRRVYKRMYARLQPLYEDIMKITGYPPS